VFVYLCVIVSVVNATNPRTRKSVDMDSYGACAARFREASISRNLEFRKMFFSLEMAVLTLCH